jgi:hypothetical protein
VLNLLDDEDAATFLSAIPNIDYRCQVLHECVNCKTNVGIYAVATTRIAFVLIVIVSSQLQLAYREYTNLVRKETVEEWVKFRTVPHSGHVPSNIATLVQQLFLTISAGKRKRSDTAALAASSGNEGDEGEEPNILMNDVNGGNLPEAAVANDNLDGEAGQCSIEGNEAAPATRVKTSYADNRRWSFRCTCKIHVEINGRRKPKNVSRIDG